MKGKIGALALGLALLLTGCSWLQGSYVSVEPHRNQWQGIQTEAIAAANYAQLRSALEDLIASGTEKATINVSGYPAEAVDSGMHLASRQVMQAFPMGAYAVEDIHYEQGTSMGQRALAVEIQYRRTLPEIQRIRTVADGEKAREAVAQALENVEARVVLLEQRYEIQDFSQFVQDYARDNPQAVMEVPQVTQTVYGEGVSRVVELVFTYQNGRDVLRRMQSEVKPVFEAASLYVSGEDAHRQKFAQLYAFLMERYEYKYETSITPAYSLLRHGVGDSRAFAMVYAAMCRGAGLECMVVAGAHAGEPWNWNIVVEDGMAYHVDLIRCSMAGGYQQYTDQQMAGYVWDYSAYPVCTGKPAAPETPPAPQPAPQPAAPQEPQQTVPDATQPTQPTQPTQQPAQETTAPATEETTPEDTEPAEP